MTKIVRHCLQNFWVSPTKMQKLKKFSIFWKNSLNFQNFAITLQNFLGNLNFQAFSQKEQTFNVQRYRLYFVLRFMYDPLASLSFGLF